MTTEEIIIQIFCAVDLQTVIEQPHGVQFSAESRWRWVRQAVGYLRRGSQ
jgi:hypothetical protein